MYSFLYYVVVQLQWIDVKCEFSCIREMKTAFDESLVTKNLRIYIELWHLDES